MPIKRFIFKLFLKYFNWKKKHENFFEIPKLHSPRHPLPKNITWYRAQRKHSNHESVNTVITHLATSMAIIWFESEVMFIVHHIPFAFVGIVQQQIDHWFIQSTEPLFFHVFNSIKQSFLFQHEILCFATEKSNEKRLQKAASFWCETKSSSRNIKDNKKKISHTMKFSQCLHARWGDLLKLPTNKQKNEPGHLEWNRLET